MGAMPRIDIHGVGLEVERIPGPTDRAPLVFLHEGLGSVSLWRQRGRSWPADLCAATGRSGWVYSRRGYGQSDPVADGRGPGRMDGFWHIGRHEPDYMHREALDVLPALLDALGVQRPVLIGHSDGATIALIHAARHAVTATVVMAPHVFVEDIAIQAISTARDAYDSTLRDRLARHHADVDNAFWQWNDVWLSDAFRRFDIRDECAGIATPLMLVQGRQDEYGTLEQLRAIERAVPHAMTLEIDHCGHSPHRDHPEALTRAVAAFLAPFP
ncbi:alpha/beta hydrolase [Hydrogenophaga sp. IBVHS2]|nr:alpha/beta hydrolase [Hydrogenophaga sp. IBVHS2]